MAIANYHRLTGEALEAANKELGIEPTPEPEPEEEVKKRGRPSKE